VTIAQTKEISRLGHDYVVKYEFFVRSLAVEYCDN
jgi:hypothetical protein